MHEHEEDHQEVIDEAYEELEKIFENSKQGVYLYLDDNHKVCNKKFAELLGYSSPEEWAEIKESFPETFVAEGSQEILVSAFQNAVEDLVASTNSVTWKKKDGTEIETTVILVPFEEEDHLMALHFVS